MTKLIQPLKFININEGVDYILPMPSDYKFELQKVYVEEPTRNNSGAIAVFPDKFFVPYFTVTWNVIKLDDYSTIMRLIQADELVTEYYDTNEQEYKRAKFYVQQPTYNKLYTMQREFQFVTNLQLVFAGTMNDIDTISVSYNANGGTGSIDTISGLMGDEVILSSGDSFSNSGYVLDSWNTKADGTGTRYDKNSLIVLTYNLTLYAQWVVSEYYNVYLAYGYASGNSTLPADTITVNKTSLSISGLPTTVTVSNSGTNDEILDPDGYSVYIFAGWYKLSQETDPERVSTKFSNGDSYPYTHDTTFYAHFNIKEYTLTFDSQGGTEIDPITTQFRATISIPKPSRDGYTFKGWYYIVTDDSGKTEEKQFASSSMPYRNLQLYAKWEAK